MGPESQPVADQEDQVPVAVLRNLRSYRGHRVFRGLLFRH